eukprot:3253680-Amphidinium_carterae.1
MAAQGGTCEPNGSAGPIGRSFLAFQSLPNDEYRWPGRCGGRPSHQRGTRAAAQGLANCTRQPAFYR